MHFEEQAGHEPRQTEGPCEPENDANEGRSHCLEDDSLQDLGLAGPDGHPDPDLGSLLGHRVGLNPINAGQGKEKGQGGEDAHQHHEEALASHGLPHHIL